MEQMVINDKTRVSSLVWVVLRVALGAILIWKGFHFIRDTFILEHLTGENAESFFTTNDAVWILLAALLTLIGGLFIIADFFTQTVALILLPVFLIGSLYIHAGYIERSGFELVLTGLVPFLLLGFITKTKNEIK